MRRTQGWSQRELADRSGVSLRFLGQVESDAANVSLTRLREVAGALGVSVVTLLAGSGPVSDAVDQVARHAWQLGAEGAAALARRLVPSRGRHVSLVGLRGAGKSTVGSQAARQLGHPFVNVDQEVRERAGLSLADLFELHGTTGYHRYCREVLERWVDHPQPVVLEVGGSVVADPESWRLLDEHTRVVWLRASANAHLQRVRDQGDTRPMAGLADARARISEILALREPLYRRAHLAIDTEAEGLDGAVAHVVATARAGAETDETGASELPTVEG